MRYDARYYWPFVLLVLVAIIILSRSLVPRAQEAVPSNVQTWTIRMPSEWTVDVVQTPSVCIYWTTNRQVAISRAQLPAGKGC